MIGYSRIVTQPKVLNSIVSLSMQHGHARLSQSAGRADDHLACAAEAFLQAARRAHRCGGTTAKIVLCCLLLRRQLPMDQAATKLQGVVQHHLLCHIAAYGKEHLKPKVHYMWDVAEQLARDPFVLDCFVV